MGSYASLCVRLSVRLSVVGPKFRLEINSYPIKPFTSYNDDGVLHWQVGSHQRQVASLVLPVSLPCPNSPKSSDILVTLQVKNSRNLPISDTLETNMPSLV